MTENEPDEVDHTDHGDGESRTSSETRCTEETSLEDRIEEWVDEPPSDEVELVVFDFDGTLAEQRGSWGLLYRLFGVEAAGRERTDAYWNGELTFEAWCRENVADWRERNVTRSHIEQAAAAVKLTTGADDLLTYLSKYDLPFGVLSSGLRDLMSRVEAYDPAFVVSNKVVYDDGTPVDATVRVGPSDKDDALLEICDRHGVELEDVVYVGDSHSDTEAFEVAGAAILFDPDDRLSEADIDLADYVVERRDLRRILPYITRTIG
ncbi:HAD family phosphatase [Halogeometricum sp. CBA1124]|uniref:HAD family hydrolase n=1 Tax=Halogeometricum sp. CBA1124 TaxID=2668071 RepID=UPI0018D232D0|nr:HAD family phosphatase [Halogeometricum sp. CBA1124]